LGLDLGPFGDREAEIGEDFCELVHDLADRVHRAVDAFRGRQRQVDPLGRELAPELCTLKFSFAIGDRARDALAERVDLRGFGRARPRVHCAERLEQSRDRPGLAERRDTQRLEVAEAVGGGNPVEHGFGVDHRARL